MNYPAASCGELHPKGLTSDGRKGGYGGIVTSVTFSGRLLQGDVKASYKKNIFFTFLIDKIILSVFTCPLRLL